MMSASLLRVCTGAAGSRNRLSINCYRQNKKNNILNDASISVDNDTAFIILNHTYLAHFTWHLQISVTYGLVLSVRITIVSKYELTGTNERIY